jgi:hypothetical protein
MNASKLKALVASFTAIGLAATTAPALAGGWRYGGGGMGGWHGGMGAWNGGAGVWHGRIAGWRGGNWHGGYWHGGRVG